MGLLRSVGNSTDSYIVFFFLVVEKSLPARKRTILAGASHHSTYSYVGLSSLGYPREGGCGQGQESLRRDPYTLGTNPYRDKPLEIVQ
jgi:hypothetical protein